MNENTKEWTETGYAIKLYGEWGPANPRGSLRQEPANSNGILVRCVSWLWSGPTKKKNRSEVKKDMLLLHCITAKLKWISLTINSTEICIICFINYSCPHHSSITHPLPTLQPFDYSVPSPSKALGRSLRASFSLNWKLLGKWDQEMGWEKW